MSKLRNVWNTYVVKGKARLNFGCIGVFVTISKMRKRAGKRIFLQSKNYVISEINENEWV